MKATFLSQFEKDIEKIRMQLVKDSIAEAIEQVEQADKLTDIPNLKKLKGFKTAYRIRIGDYRIGVFIVGNAVEFVRVVHRREVYKFFP
ncbi:type II toxin-antitoxin system RelE/ParE family toxin [Fibrella sp. HMF5335]|uniref:Type II toxin-antitoxin system RelE/ParE family toxin n=1 Tax=Fibrella rubiginis TaxID=2817060 RepID=A0A939K5T0_9BACT|nr:type II toxin-antitoxin system RelE/ParE family toxin [Fibrella rubiginis]MBO0936790.1 type II toxin-antitoxin system RelE/ParE family toxin [Fibrella rubiginis]